MKPGEGIHSADCISRQLPLPPQNGHETFYCPDCHSVVTIKDGRQSACPVQSGEELDFERRSEQYMLSLTTNLGCR